MRRCPLLLGLLLALGACGPGGLTARAPDAPLRFEADEAWATVRARLRAAVQGGPEPLRLETRYGERTHRIAWSPRSPAPGRAPSDLLVAVVLVVAEGAECLEVSVRGSAWTARYGCGAATRRRIPGWGEAARPGLGSVLDDALAALDADPSRLAVDLAVSAAAVEAATWADVFPLVDEATSTGAATVRIEGTLPRSPARRCVIFPETSLQWLAAHQSPDGRWEAAGFGGWCDGNEMRDPADDGRGHTAYDVGATALTLSAFLGAGYTNRGRHPFAKTVSKGLRYLKKEQRADGCFVDPAAPWSSEQHAIATLALVEAYGITGSPIFKGAAQRSLDFLPLAYRSGSRDDLVLAAFTASALASARVVNEDARRRGREPPLFYAPGFAEDLHVRLRDLADSRSPREAAVGLLGRFALAGEPAKGGEVEAAAGIVLLEPPVRAPRARRIDAFHCLFGTLALFRVGGAPRKAWSGKLKEAVVGTQRRDGAVCCYRGSWDPEGLGSDRFGRVGATALGTLCLEVYYRYDRVFRCP